jgi:hypothetical protein
MKKRLGWKLAYLEGMQLLPSLLLLKDQSFPRDVKRLLFVVFVFWMDDVPLSTGSATF